MRERCVNLVGKDTLIELINCTVAQNNLGGWPAFLVIQGGSMRLTNSVVWGNTPVPLEIKGEWVIDTGLAGVFVGDGEMTADHCRVQYWDDTVAGTGTIECDPMFINALGDDSVAGTADDDLRIGPGSACIDAGDNSAVPFDVVMDVAGRTRFVDIASVPDTGIGTAPLIDIGSHERQLCDVNGDGLMNVVDLLLVIGAWGTSQASADLTGDGVVNVADLLAVIAAWGPCT